jgi:hypothetical protein
MISRAQKGLEDVVKRDFENLISGRHKLVVIDEKPQKKVDLGRENLALQALGKHHDQVDELQTPRHRVMLD